MSDAAAPSAPAAQPAAPQANANQPIDAKPVEGAIPQEQAQEIQEEIKKLGKKKLKLKVDGQELEEELDLDDEEGLKKHLQLSKAAQKRMQEYSTLRKEVEDLVKLIQQNPELVLERAGHDVDSLAEKRLARKLEDMQKSPEQKKQEEMELKLKEYEEQAKKAEEEKAELKREQIMKEQMQTIDNEIMEALGANPDLPHSPYVVKRIADYMSIALEMAEDPNSGIDADQVTVKNIIPVVKQALKGEFQQMFGKLPESALEDILGKDNVSRLRNFRLSKPKAAPQNIAAQIQKTGNDVTITPPAKDRVKAKDFFRKLGNR